MTVPDAREHNQTDNPTSEALWHKHRARTYELKRICHGCAFCNCCTYDPEHGHYCGDRWWRMHK